MRKSSARVRNLARQWQTARTHTRRGERTHSSTDTNDAPTTPPRLPATIADRRKVLRHHPDKNAASHGGRTDEDSFFKCIQKGKRDWPAPASARTHAFPSRC